MENNTPTNGSQKQAGVAILISDNAYFNQNLVMIKKATTY
jgi:hypothetical protein